MKLRSIELTKIKPYWRNPRYSEKAVNALKVSIKEYGFNQPLVLDKKFVIICGHTRYVAAKELGFKRVPCVVAELPPKKAKEYRLADNKVSDLSDWVIPDLEAELKEIGDLSRLESIFIDMDLEKLINEALPSADTGAVSDKDLKRQEDELAGAFSGKSKEVQDDYLELTCPSCGEDFTVSKSDMERRFERLISG